MAMVNHKWVLFSWISCQHGQHHPQLGRAALNLFLQALLFYFAVPKLLLQRQNLKPKKKSRDQKTSGSRTWSGLPGQDRDNMKTHCLMSWVTWTWCDISYTSPPCWSNLKHTCASASVWRPESARAGIAWASASWRWWSEAGAISVWMSKDQRSECSDLPSIHLQMRCFP